MFWWMGRVIGFWNLCIGCCFSLTARVSVDGMCDYCYLAAVSMLKFDLHESKLKLNCSLYGHGAIFVLQAPNVEKK